MCNNWPGPDCKFKTYEMKKLNWLKMQLSEAVSSLQEEKKKVTKKDIAVLTELLGLVNNIQELLNDKMDRNTGENANQLSVGTNKDS